MILSAICLRRKKNTKDATGKPILVLPVKNSRVVYDLRLCNSLFAARTLRFLPSFSLF